MTAAGAGQVERENPWGDFGMGLLGNGSPGLTAGTHPLA
jgi:hypothetical protein